MVTLVAAEEVKFRCTSVPDEVILINICISPRKRKGTFRIGDTPEVIGTTSQKRYKSNQSSNKTKPECVTICE